MVSRTLTASNMEEEYEEDMYLRKCSGRKSKRQNEKSRKLAFQASEASNRDRTPSPTPPSGSRHIHYTSTVKKTKDRSNIIDYPSSPRNTDDPYPIPSPPPRSPFSSPVFSGRPLALSLSLRSPGGFIISTSDTDRTTKHGSGRKGLSCGTYSPEPNVLDYHTSSYDSASSWGDSASGTAFSPRSDTSIHSPKSPTIYLPDNEHSPLNYTNNTTTTSSSKDSSRVKQFLFHRDRDRARKARILYHAAFGNTDDYDNYPDDEPDSTGPERTGADGNLYTPANNSYNNSNSSGGKKITRSGSNKCSIGSNEKYLRVDLETDIRAGTSGLTYTPTTTSSSKNTPTSRSSNKNSNNKHTSVQYTPNSGNTVPLKLSPFTPVRTSSMQIEIAQRSLQNNIHSTTTTTVGTATVDSPVAGSPYYRALTLGCSTPYDHTLPCKPAVVGSCDRDDHSSNASSSASSIPSVVSLQDMQLQPGVSLQDTASEVKDSYEAHFPALPIPTKQNVHTLSALSHLSLEINSNNSNNTTATLSTTILESAEVKTQPLLQLPHYTVQEITDMFYKALLTTVMIVNNDTTELDTSTDVVPTFRAWDDADSSDEDSDSDDSSRNSHTTDSSTSSRTSKIYYQSFQKQIQKLGIIDVTCVGLMQKCDYIRNILKTRHSSRFEKQWVNMQLLPYINTILTTTTTATTSSSSNDKNVLSLKALLNTGYIHTSFLYELVQAVQYEDSRFESTRLPILYTLYISELVCGSSINDNSTGGSSSSSSSSNGYSIRNKIAQAIVYTCTERRQRCEHLLATATALEVDINYISKIGYSELFTCSNTTTATASLTTNCNINAVIQSENERPAFKTRDSDSSLIELIKYIITQEIGSIMHYQQVLEDKNDNTQGWSDEMKTTTYNDTKAANTTNSSNSSIDSDSRHTLYKNSMEILCTLTHAYNQLFRCYTHKLGACHPGAADNVEHPVQLEQLLQCLDGLLAWAKVLVNLGPTTENVENKELSTSALDKVCELILSSTVKYWGDRVNYARDIAYMLQSEVVLTLYAPNSSSNNNSGSSVVQKSYITKFMQNKGVLPPLCFTKHTSSSSSSTGSSVHYNTTTTMRVLQLLLARLTCPHTKVASQALQSLQNPVLMVRYFLPRMPTAMASYLFGTEVGRITFLSGTGWENIDREECLNSLVDKLRTCREIFSQSLLPQQEQQLQLQYIQLQCNSTQLLDTTLELLQIIEDNE